MAEEECEEEDFGGERYEGMPQGLEGTRRAWLFL